jgi:HSP20 family protein
MQPHANGMINVDAALSDVARIYRSITGRELPRSPAPVAPIPPERDPRRVAQDALEQLAGLLQRHAPPGNELPRTMPLVDCWESPDELCLVIDLPGVERSSVQVRLEGGALLVSGRRERHAPEGARPAALERPLGVYERRILLPHGITAEPLSASLSEGVLRLRLSRKQGPLSTRSISVG